MVVTAEKAVMVERNRKRESDKKSGNGFVFAFLLKKKIIFYIFLKKRKKIVDKYKTF